MKNVPDTGLPINKIAFFSSPFNVKYQSFCGFYYTEFSFCFWQMAHIQSGVQLYIIPIIYTSEFQNIYFKKTVINGKKHLVKWGQSERDHLPVDLKVKRFVNPQPLTMLCVNITMPTPLATKRYPVTAQQDWRETLFKARLQVLGLDGGKLHRFKGSLIFFNFCQFYWSFPNATYISDEETLLRGQAGAESMVVPSLFHRFLGELEERCQYSLIAPSHQPPTSNSYSTPLCPGSALHHLPVSPTCLPLPVLISTLPIILHLMHLKWFTETQLYLIYCAFKTRKKLFH